MTGVPKKDSPEDVETKRALRRLEREIKSTPKVDPKGGKNPPKPPKR